MDKKAFIGMSIVDLWSMILIVIILVGFAFLFGVGKVTAGTNERFLNDQRNAEAERLLYTFLKSDADNVNMIEYILANTDDFSKVESYARILLDIQCNDPRYKPEDCYYWEIVLMKDGENYRINAESEYDNLDFKKNAYADFLLPNKDKKMIIRMIIYYDVKEPGESYPK